MHYNDTRVGTPILFKPRFTTGGTVELWGGTNMGWEFHIRGPDGPRGGSRTLCGQRMRRYWDVIEVDFGKIFNRAIGDQWGSEFRLEGYDAWGSYYYARPCETCSRRYLLKADA